MILSSSPSAASLTLHVLESFSHLHSGEEEPLREHPGPLHWCFHGQEDSESGKLPGFDKRRKIRRVGGEAPASKRPVFSGMFLGAQASGLKPSPQGGRPHCVGPLWGLK